jgi:hypothetical protein
MEEFDLVESLMAYEDGVLNQAAEIELFSHLIKTGQAWELQGHYGRIASGYIMANVIDEFGTILIDNNMN